MSSIATTTTNNNTIYLVTGTNRARGIAFGLVSHILETHPNAFVYAGARAPENSAALQGLKDKYSGRVSLVKYNAGDVENNSAIAKEIEKRHGRVDTVIAGAATDGGLKRVDSVSVEGMEGAFHVNVMGPVVLFQAVYALLKKSASPRFVAVSSRAGVISGGVVEAPVNMVSYGASKAALNWATRKIHFENDWLVAFPVCPGVVDTEGRDGTLAADESNMLKAFAPPHVPTPAEIAVPFLKLIDESTREKDGGLFAQVEGGKSAW